MRIFLFLGVLVLCNAAPRTLGSQGCWKDSSSRIMPAKSTVTTTNSLESCDTFCSGYTYFGVQNGQDCWCDNTYSTQYGVATNCNVTCTGNANEICGGVWAMSIYKRSYQGCWTDGSSPRILPSKSTFSSTNSLESCDTFCAGYTYFGVENGQDCWCGNTYSTQYGVTTNCNVACTGNANEICGGVWAMSIYKQSGSAFSYQGCWTDGSSPRILPSKSTLTSTNSLESCNTFCAGYTYFGVENGQDCWCDNTYSTQYGSSNNCNVACTGNANEICGGVWAMSIYKQGTIPYPLNQFTRQGLFYSNDVYISNTGPMALNDCATSCYNNSQCGSFTYAYSNSDKMCTLFHGIANKIATTLDYQFYTK